MFGHNSSSKRPTMHDPYKVPFKLNISNMTGRAIMLLTPPQNYRFVFFSHDANYLLKNKTAITLVAERLSLTIPGSVCRTLPPLQVPPTESRSPCLAQERSDSQSLTRPIPTRTKQRSGRTEKRTQTLLMLVCRFPT